VRKANIADLEVIVDFTVEEAREAEGRAPERKTIDQCGPIRLVVIVIM